VGQILGGKKIGYNRQAHIDQGHHPFQDGGLLIPQGYLPTKI